MRDESIQYKIMDIENINPFEDLYEIDDTKYCLGCDHKELLKPKGDGENIGCDLLYCQSCNICYTNAQYNILFRAFNKKYGGK